MITLQKSNLTLQLLQRQLALARQLHVSSACRDGDEYRMLDRIGKREVVGFGLNGNPIYVDRADFPHPAIRFQEENDAIRPIRQKERGDWKNLTLDEKKQLYRFSYQRTFAEVDAPTGLWRVIAGCVLAGLALGNLAMVACKKFLNPPLPRTFSEEWREAMLERMIDMESEPITGLATKWDYENQRWK